MAMAVTKYLSVLMVLSLILIVADIWSVHKGSSIPPRSQSRMQDTKPTFRKFQPMVLSLDYWEQTGNNLKNLFDLQCWANSVNISKVVEPTILSGQASDNVFHFPIQEDKSAIRFRDYFDIDYWNWMSSKYRNSMIVSKENFLRHASRKVIYVQMIKFAIIRKQRCKSLPEIAVKKWFKFLIHNGFNISLVCIEALGFPIADSIFQDKIFNGSTNDVPVTIVFEQWRGFKSRNNDRLELTGSRCGQRFLSGLMTPHLTLTEPQRIRYPHFSPSPLVLSKKLLGYLDTFLSKHLQGTQYVAVMLRSEKLDSSILSTGPNERFCMEILSDHKKALNLINGTTTLFCSDFGVHGSSSLKVVSDNFSLSHPRLKWKVAANHFSQDMENTLKPDFSLEQINSLLQNVTKSKDSVLIGLLQSALVARASCIVMVGGGTFQILTLNMYAHSHRRHECYFFRNSQCIQQYIDHFNNRKP